MDELQKIRAALAVMEKHTSLRQVSIQSGINYITLRNIKSGKSGRVTDSVAARFNKFQEKFAASPDAVASPRMRNATAAPAPAAKKPGPKPKAGGKKPGPKPKAAAAPAPASAPAPVAAAPKKPGPKPKAGRKKAGRPAKSAVVSTPAPLPAAVPVSSLLGGTLTKEIAMAEARLDFLKQLQNLEADFLRKIGK